MHVRRTALRGAGILLCALVVALAMAAPFAQLVDVAAQAVAPAPMPTSRTLPGAGLATNGQIYVVGGSTGILGPLVTNEAYDTVANMWVPRADLPVREYGASVVGAANGLVYAIGGGFSNSSNNVFSYDPTANVWTQRTSIPASVGGGGPGPGMGAAVVGGKIYVAGGYSSRRLRIYNTATDSWMAGSDMLQARQSFGLVAMPNGKLYAFGGSNGQSTNHASVEMYDPSTDTWTPRANMSQARWPVNGALGGDGRIYAIGPGASAEGYDPEADRWEAIPPPLLVRQYAAVAPTADGRIVVIGGATGAGWQNATNAVEIYTPATASWSPNYPMPAIDSITSASGTYTGSPNITIRMQASGGSGGVTHMSFSNDGANWSDWRPYAIETAWTIPAVDGTTLVSARVRDGVGNISGAAILPVTLDTRKPFVTSFVINNNAEQAPAVQVTLSVQATVPPGGTSVSAMSFSNDGATWSNWEPYTTTKSWELTPGGGPRTVYVRVRNSLGIGSDPAQESIELDAVPPTGSVTIPATASASGLRAASPTRQIQLTATDNLTPQAQLQMRLSNRPDFAGAIWKPFASSTSWDFTGGATVYAQFKDGAGNVSQTYSQSLAGGPSGGTSPAPSCSPRPRIVLTTHVSNGALIVTVNTTGSNNGLLAVRFDSFSNAIVHAGSQTNQTAPFAVSIPPGQEPTSLQFAVLRQVSGQSTTVRLVVIDGCGEWSTFVGGGPNAF